MIRGQLLRLAEDEHVLLVTMHHIVSDGWSVGVLIKELSALYEAFSQGRADPLAPLAVQYADYAAWQRGWLEGSVGGEQVRYWQKALAERRRFWICLPIIRVLHSRIMLAPWLGCALMPELSRRLKALSRRHGVTLYMTLLAGWAAVLSRLSGQDEVVIGSPSANRGRAELEGLIGFFVNTLALRVDLSGSPSVAELLGRVKAVSLGAQSHQDLPFEQVVEIVQPPRSLAHAPVFQAMFAWQNAPEGVARTARSGAVAGPKPPCCCQVRSVAVAWRGRRRDRRRPGICHGLVRAGDDRALSGYRRQLLEGMAADDSQAIDRLPLLSEARSGIRFLSSGMQRRRSIRGQVRPRAVRGAGGADAGGGRGGVRGAASSPMAS